MKNETFYVVAATIIPIYFLALTLQGAFYEKFQQYVESGIDARDAFIINFLRRSLESGGKFTHRDITGEEKMKYVLDTYRIELIKIVSAVLVVVVLWPTFGELVAIIALYNNQTSLWQNIVVESSVILLVVATACIILARLYAPYYMLIFRVMQLAIPSRMQSALSRRNNPSHESSASSEPEIASEGGSDANTRPSQKNITPMHEKDVLATDKQPDVEGNGRSLGG